MLFESAVPGVEFAYGFKNEQGRVIVSMGYADEETYQQIVHSENGAVRRIMAEHNIEEISNWVSSDRGESFD